MADDREAEDMRGCLATVAGWTLFALLLAAGIVFVVMALHGCGLEVAPGHRTDPGVTVVHGPRDMEDAGE